MLSLTQKASKEINRLKLNETKDYFLRFSISGGGCSGLNYQLGFDLEINPNDKIFEEDGIKIIVDSKSLLFVFGMEIDFSDGLNGKGFVFNNPNAKRVCGCGTSFSV